MPEQLTIAAAAPKGPPPGRRFARLSAQVRAEQATDSGEPRATFVISTGDVARDGHVIMADGWELDNYRKNPVVLWSHDYGFWASGQLPVIGRTEEIGVKDGALVATARFTSADTYEFGNTVGRMVEAGFLHAASVGWDPIEWTYDEQRGGYTFIRQELLEWSVVPIPADAAALVQRAAARKLDLRPYVRELARALDGEVRWGVAREDLEAVHREVAPVPVTVDLAAAFAAGYREAQVRATVGEVLARLSAPTHGADNRSKTP